MDLLELEESQGKMELQRTKEDQVKENTWFKNKTRQVKKIEGSVLVLTVGWNELINKSILQRVQMTEYRLKMESKIHL